MARNVVKEKGSADACGTHHVRASSVWCSAGVKVASESQVHLLMNRNCCHVFSF